MPQTSKTSQKESATNASAMKELSALMLQNLAKCKRNPKLEADAEAINKKLGIK